MLSIADDKTATPPTGLFINTTILFKSFVKERYNCLFRKNVIITTFE
jgi:hypothetical protein